MAAVKDKGSCATTKGQLFYSSERNWSLIFFSFMSQVICFILSICYICYILYNNVGFVTCLSISTICVFLVQLHQNFLKALESFLSLHKNNSHFSWWLTDYSDQRSLEVIHRTDEDYYQFFRKHFKRGKLKYVNLRFIKIYSVYLL